MREDGRGVEDIAAEFGVPSYVIVNHIRSQARAGQAPPVDEEPLIDEPVDPPEALRTLERLPTRRSIPGVAVLLAERRRR